MTAALRPVPRADRRLIMTGSVVAVALALLPLVGSALVIDKLSLFFTYLLMAVMWNLLAGYAGLVSVGQQAFVGLGGYAMLRLVEAGLPPFVALPAGAALVGLAAWPMSLLVLRLKPGEFAIATWVIAETIRAVVTLDPLVQGETGRSLVALNAYDPELRRNAIYLMALAASVLALAGSWWLLQGRLGAESQAIRDDEEAAGSVGISTFRVKQVVFIVAALGCALAGGLWLASAITFQPRTAFGIQWSVFMLFMVLVGGLGRFTGPFLGAVVFMALQETFAGFGAWYLAGIGIVAILFALRAPRGLVGLLADRLGREPLTIHKLLGGRPDLD